MYGHKPIISLIREAKSPDVESLIRNNKLTNSLIHHHRFYLNMSVYLLDDACENQVAFTYGCTFFLTIPILRDLANFSWHK